MNKKLIATAVLFLTAFILRAEETESAIGFGKIMLIADILLLIVALLLINLLSFTVKQIKHAVKPNNLYISWWERFAALGSNNTEEELELHENYDGIKELNNPTPPWFNFIFYSTIIFALIYFLNYHIIGFGKLQEDEYKQELTDAAEAKAAYLKTSGNLIDENNVSALLDAATVNEGKNIYMANCKVCHGGFGEGIVGPNLTDDYWIHGNTINDIFKTIKYGVPQKGMVPWQNTLTALQIQQVSSYIFTLKDSNPKNPKAPQGIKTASSKSAVKDSTNLFNDVTALN